MRGREFRPFRVGLICLGWVPRAMPWAIESLRLRRGRPHPTHREMSPGAPLKDKRNRIVQRVHRKHCTLQNAGGWLWSSGTIGNSLERLNASSADFLNQGQLVTRFKLKSQETKPQRRARQWRSCRAACRTATTAFNAPAHWPTRCRRRRFISVADTAEARLRRWSAKRCSMRASSSADNPGSSSSRARRIRVCRSDRVRSGRQAKTSLKLMFRTYRGTKRPSA